MHLQDWEVTIQEIVDECKHEQKAMGEYTILLKWRAKLEKEPTRLEPFQIDEIVREVRRRFSDPAG